MSSSKKNICVYLGKVILITLLIVLIIRCFFVESFTVSSSQIETTLQVGDEVLIDKTAYGIRMPITVLSIPFTFDQLWGKRSYFSAIQLPYARLFTGQISRNDIVLFNNPLEEDKPLDKRSLLLNRCCAVPGDTVLIHSLLSGAIDDVDQVFDSELVDNMLTVVLPFKGKEVEINENSLIVYGQAICQEQGDAAVIDGGTLFINGEKRQTYTFEDDYYWMQSDNPYNSLDSQTLGFIPFKNVIGKARFIWYNPDPSARANRCFKTLE